MLSSNHLLHFGLCAGKRQRAALELLESERFYVSHLSLLLKANISFNGSEALASKDKRWGVVSQMRKTAVIFITSLQISVEVFRCLFRDQLLKISREILDLKLFPHNTALRGRRSKTQRLYFYCRSHLRWTLSESRVNSSAWILKNIHATNLQIPHGASYLI